MSVRHKNHQNHQNNNITDTPSRHNPPLLPNNPTLLRKKAGLSNVRSRLCPSAVRALERGKSDVLGDGLETLLGIDGLRLEIVAACLEGSLTVAVEGIGRERNDGKVGHDGLYLARGF